MNSLKVINSNIDTKDFRLEADSIRDDYSNALTMIKRHSDNITRSGEGVIAYDNLTADGVTFKNHSSNDQAGAIFIGPGMSYDRSYFKNSITNCTFEGNKADHVGGAIRLFHIDDRNVIKNCKFTDNFANNRVSNILVQYGHGLGDKLAKEWGNTSNAMKYNNNANGVSIVYK